MAKWTFFGRILPERFPFSLGGPISGASTAEKHQVSYTWTIRIFAGQIVASVDVTNGAPDVLTLRNFIQDEIRVIADTVGYLTGFSFDVEIISASCLETDEWQIFGIGIPVVTDRRDQTKARMMNSGLLEDVMRHPSAQIVLADFREAMRSAVGTGFFCYRAVEAMMQSMKKSEAEKEKEVWPRLRDALCVDLSAIEYLKAHADFPRHGKPNAITGEERAHVFQITDVIIERYLKYLQGGRKPLLEAEFPTITALGQPAPQLRF